MIPRGGINMILDTSRGLVQKINLTTDKKKRNPAEFQTRSSIDQQTIAGSKKAHPNEGNGAPRLQMKPSAYQKSEQAEDEKMHNRI